MFPFAHDDPAEAAAHGEPSVIPLAPQSIDFQPLRSSSHPSLRFTLNTTLPSFSDFLSVRQGCHIHLDLSFPDALFIDREELRDTLGDIAWTLEPDFIDIERPVLPRGPDGEHPQAMSHLYLEMRHIDDKYTEETKVKVPLHARYLAPREDGHETVWLFSGGQSGEVRGGWVCGGDRHKNLPIVPTLPLTVTLPTGRPSHQPIVEFGTVLAIWLCFGWLAYKITKTARRLDGGGLVKGKRL